MNKTDGICEDAKFIGLRQCSRIVFLLAVLMSSLVGRADSMSYQFTLDRTTQVGPGSNELQITSFVLGPSTPHAFLTGFPGVFLQYGNVDTLQLEYVDGVLIHESTELDTVTFGAPNGIPFTPTPTGSFVLATGGAVYFSMATESPLFTGDPSSPTFLPGHYNDPNQPGSDLEIQLITPEPSSVVLLGTGMVAVAGTIRRKLKAHAG